MQAIKTQINGTGMQKGAGLLIKTLYIIYIGLVLFFCFYNFSMPDLDLAKYFLGIRLDRYAHFIMFFPYPFIAWLTCNYSRHISKWKKHSLIITFVSGLLFAAATELIQNYCLDSRQGDPLDLAADSIGILLGTIFVSLIGHWMVRSVESLFTSRSKTK